MKTLVTVVFVLLTSTVYAQTTLIARIDAFRSSSPSYSTGAITPVVEAWFFNLPGFPVYEVGKLLPVPVETGNTLLAGGYLSYWEKTKQSFAEPWVYYQGVNRNVKLALQFAGYIPLNGGPAIFFSDECSLVTATGQGFDLGLATAFWHQDGASTPIRFGPTIKGNLSKKVSYSARALLFGGRAQDSYRFELSTTF